MGKVYFIGAGFSKACGGPLTDELVAWIFDEENAATAFLWESGRGDRLRQVREELSTFTRTVFGEGAHPRLQDILTVLDRAASDSLQVKAYSLSAIRSLRASIDLSMSWLFEFLFHQFLMEVPRAFAHCIHLERADAIITSNWDLLLEWGFRAKGMAFDYGCRCVWCSVSGAMRLTPLPAAPKGALPAVPLLKLHGSFNWLFCSRCTHLLAMDGDSLAYSEVHSCPMCGGKGRGPESTVTTETIAPTFIKSYGRLHYAQVWDAAAKELQKADEVIFIGYSLPDDDFEVRALLARNLPSSARVLAILRESDEGAVADRYRDFFGADRCCFDFTGLARWLYGRLPEADRQLVDFRLLLPPSYLSETAGTDRADGAS